MPKAASVRVSSAVSRPQQTWRRAMAIQSVAFTGLFLATLLVVLVALSVIGVIVFRGIGALTWPFLTAMPSQGMRAGGIFPGARFIRMVGDFMSDSGSIANLAFGPRANILCARP